MKKLLLKKYLLNVIVVAVIFSLMACNQIVPPVVQGTNQPTGLGVDNSPISTLQNKTVTEIKVFYGDEFNKMLVFEKRQISFTNEIEKFQNSLIELFKGPKSSNMRRNINENVKVYGVIRQNDSLIINLSKEFEGFAGTMSEIFGVGSIVNTCTQFSEIKSVKILVEGNEIIGPSGNSRGFITEFPLTATDVRKRSISLYFSDKDAIKLIKETREVTVDPSITKEEFAKLVLGEQIIGTKNKDLNSTLNAKIKVLSVKIKGDLATVNFSKELLKSCQGTTGESFAIDSIVNVLTDISGIKRVLIKLEEKTFETGHNIYDKPLTRLSTQ